MVISSRIATICHDNAYKSERYRYLKLHVTAVDPVGECDYLDLGWIGFSRTSYEFVRGGQDDVSCLLNDANFFKWPSKASVSVTGDLDYGSGINVISRENGLVSDCIVDIGSSQSLLPIDIVIDLGAGNAIDVSVYRYWGLYMGSDSFGAPSSFTLQASNDGLNWTTLDDAADNGNKTWFCTNPENLDAVKCLIYIGQVGGVSMRGAISPNGEFIFSSFYKGISACDLGLVFIDNDNDVMDQNGELPVLI